MIIYPSIFHLCIYPFRNEDGLFEVSNLLTIMDPDNYSTH